MATDISSAFRPPPLPSHGRWAACLRFGRGSDEVMAEADDG
jgi:hypothetical protein